MTVSGVNAASTGVSLDDRMQQAAETGTSGGEQTAKTSEKDNLTSEQTFLKLLVAQIKNQNPLNPMDGVQFVSQLAQFSELEQIIQIRTQLEKFGKDAQTPAETAGA